MASPFHQDIRGKNFSKTSCIGGNFRNARAGRKSTQNFLLLILGIIITFTLSIILIISAGFIAGAIYNSIQISVILCGSTIGLYSVSLIFFVAFGFRGIAIGSALLSIAINVCLALLLSKDANLIWMFSIGLIAGIAMSYVGSVSTAFSVLFNSFCFKSVGFFLVIFTSFLITTSIIFLSSRYTADHKPAEEIVSLVPVFPILLAGSILARKILRGTTPFAWVEEQALSWATIGGTSFYGLDLTDACFDNADLRYTDFRKANLIRTSFHHVTGLGLARLKGTILEDVQVRQLLITRQGHGQDFTGRNLSGADLREGDLRQAIFVRTDATRTNFTRSNLTGVCIQDWNINNETLFTNVQCDYVYRKLDRSGKPTDRFPTDRDFEPREFESLYQEVGNVVELIFKEGVNWRAVAFTLQKLQIEDEGLGLELRGIEKRGDLWIVKVAHDESVSGAEVERRLYSQIEEMQKLLATKEQQINKLLGIASDQAEALKGFSGKSFGNSFFITGSTITNLTGQGQIEYAEAANQVRSIIASAVNPGQMTTTAQTLISQLQSQEVAVTLRTQTELIQQILLTEAQKDPVFQQFLLQQGQQIIDAMPNVAIATAIRGAIAQLNSVQGSSNVI